MSRKTQISRAWRDVSKRGVAAALLKGRVIAIDPSIGSTSSMPGYAIFVGGDLVDSGIISINATESAYARLYAIGQSLRTEFADSPYDVLVVEEVPPARRGPGGYVNPKAQVPLHWATGAIMCSVTATHHVFVSPTTWHGIAGPGHVKSDEADAIAIGRAAIHLAGRVREKTRGGRGKK